MFYLERRNSEQNRMRIEIDNPARADAHDPAGPTGQICFRLLNCLGDVDRAVECDTTHGADLEDTDLAAFRIKALGHNSDRNTYAFATSGTHDR